MSKFDSNSFFKVLQPRRNLISSDSLILNSITLPCKPCEHVSAKILVFFLCEQTRILYNLVILFFCSLPGFELFLKTEWTIFPRLWPLNRDRFSGGIALFLTLLHFCWCWRRKFLLWAIFSFLLIPYFVFILKDAL